MTRVIVGVDGSRASSAALRWAAAQAARSGADLEVLVVWDLPPGWPRVDLVAPGVLTDLEDLADTTLREALHAARSVAGGGVTVDGRVLRGSPARLLTAAAEPTDLLVVGNVGHSRLDGLLLGSVADTVVRHAPCPVAVIGDRVAADDRTVPADEAVRS